MNSNEIDNDSTNTNMPPKLARARSIRPKNVRPLKPNTLALNLDHPNDLPKSQKEDLQTPIDPSNRRVVEINNKKLIIFSTDRRILEEADEIICKHFNL